MRYLDGDPTLLTSGNPFTIRISRYNQALTMEDLVELQELNEFKDRKAMQSFQIIRDDINSETSLLCLVGVHTYKLA